MNTRIVRALVAALLVTGLLAIGHPVASSTPPNPAINYLFNGNLTDSGGGSTATASEPCPQAGRTPCISNSGFATDAVGPHWWWESTGDWGGGLVVDTTVPMGTTYSFVLHFAFKDVTSYRKIMDYKDRVDDTGFYVFNEELLFYNLGTAGGEILADEDYYLVAVRESTGGTAGTFTVNLRGPDGNFTEVININDPDGESIFADAGTGSRIGLFFDDVPTSGEATTEGRAYLFRAWPNEALSLEEIEESIDPGPSPTTTTTIRPTTSVSPTPTTTPTPGDLDLNLQLEFAVGDTVRNNDATVTTIGRGLAPFADLLLVLRSTPQVIGSAVTGAAGTATVVGTIPPGTPAGVHSLTGESVDPDGNVVAARAWFTLDANGIVTAISYTGPTPPPGDVVTGTPRFTG